MVDPSGGRDLGRDRRLGEVTLLTCPRCGQRWLRYLYELEAFTGSGRWYLGAVTREQADRLTADEAAGVLGELEAGYLYGGSYYDGRIGRATGPLPFS